MTSQLGTGNKLTFFYSVNLIYSLAISLAYPSGEEGGNFFVKCFLPAFAKRRGRGEGARSLWCRVGTSVNPSTNIYQCIMGAGGGGGRGV